MDKKTSINISDNKMRAACSALARWHFHDCDFVTERDAVIEILNALGLCVSGLQEQSTRLSETLQGNGS